MMSWCFDRSTRLVLALAVAPGTAVGQDPPRLVVLLTIDQGRADYLERFRPVFEGGLKRLLENGIVFADAHQYHADTVTAAGHASLSTGRHPGHSGMVANDFYDRTQGRDVYCVEDASSPLLPPAGATRMSAGRSPAQLLTDGFGDWVQAASPASKIVSVGAKDRSAVLMGGQNPDAAYWYDRTHGHWITSAYYMDRYPDWVRAFHSEKLADTYFGSEWTPLDVSHDVLATMDVGAESFRHAFGRASLYRGQSFYDALYDSPFIESYLLDFAEHLVVEEALGADETTDVLALGFASADTVGHTFGPNSREVLDTMMRIDRELETFFAFLDERVGLSRVAVSLSADHGVAPVPTEHSGGRYSAEDFVCFQAAGDAFTKEFGNDDWFVAERHFNNDTVARRGIDRSILERFLAQELSRCPSIERVWTRTEIQEASSWSEPIDPTLQLYINSYHPDRSADVFVQSKEGFMNRIRGTTHGTPYSYDTHVLTLVQWPGAEPKTITEPVKTVDLPVTLAELLGVAVPDDVDGVSHAALIR